MPARIGSFEIVRELGEGRYEARDRDGRPVSIELVPARFLREAQALARLDDPHLVPVYELGNHGDGAFVATAVVDGESLERHLAGRRLSRKAIVALFVQVGHGLHALHREGLVHGDVATANMTVDRAGHVRVGGFASVRSPATNAAFAETIAIEPPDRTLATEMPLVERAASPADDVAALARALREALGDSRLPSKRWPDVPALLADLEPKRRPLVPILAVAGVLAVGAAAAAYALRAGPAPATCEPTTYALDPAQRAQVAERYGDPVVRALDAWVARQRVTRVDVCRIPEMRARRLACLDGQARVASLLAARLASGEDEVTLPRAIRASEALPAPEVCTPAAVAHRDTSPDGGLASLQVDVELAHRNTILAIQEVADTSSPRGELLLARVLATTPSRRQAEPMFAKAAADAALAGDPVLEAEIEIAALNLAFERDTPARVDALVEAARAAIARAGDPEPLARDLAFAEANANTRVVRVDRAYAACTRGVALEGGDADRGDLDQAACECELRLAAYLDSQGACIRALHLAQRHLGDRHPRTVELGHSSAVAYAHANALEDADTVLRDSLARTEALYTKESTEYANELRLLSVLQARNGDLTSSNRTLAEALAIVGRVAPDDVLRGQIFTDIAERATTAKDVETAISIAAQGVAIMEKWLGPDHRDVAAALVIQAHALALDPARLDGALAVLEHAIAILEANTGSRQSVVLGSVVSGYARLLADHGRTTAALAALHRALEIHDEWHARAEAARCQFLAGTLLVAAHRLPEGREALEDARLRYAELAPDHAGELADVEAALANLR